MAKNAKKDLTLEEKLQNALVADWEQPYALPENWVWTRLGEVCLINPKNDIDDNLNVSFIPMSNIEGGFNNSFKTEQKVWSEIKKGYTHFKQNDIAVAKILPCFDNMKSVIFSDLLNGFGAGTTELYILRPKNNKIYNKYIFWHFKTDDFIKGGIRTYSGTVGQQRISKDYIPSYSVPLPPLAEQERIVQRIESLFAKLDSAKELLGEALESFESRKSALLHQTFTGELTKAWREKHDESMESWEEKTLSATDITIIDGDRGQNYPKKEEFSPSGFCLFLNTKNVTKKGFSFSKLEFINQEKDLLLRKGKLLRGDVVLTTRGTIGNIAFYDSQVPFEHMRINSGMVIFRFAKELLQKFFLLQFHSSHITNQISLIQSGSAQPQLPIKDLKKIFIKIPTLSEQEEIVRILDAQLQKEEEAKAHIQHSLEHIEHMKKAILARAFRGELGTNNPEETSAVELLKEILEKAS